MRDPILAGLVSATADNSELEFPIVLISSGLVIDGTLVSERRWLDELAGLLEAGPPRAALVGRVFREAAVSVGMAAALGDAGSGILHLAGASVHSGGQVEAVGLWRVAVDGVDGWQLGRARPEAVRSA